MIFAPQIALDLHVLDGAYILVLQILESNYVIVIVIEFLCESETSATFSAVNIEYGRGW